MNQSQTDTIPVVESTTKKNIEDGVMPVCVMRMTNVHNLLRVLVVDSAGNVHIMYDHSSPMTGTDASELGRIRIGHHVPVTAWWPQLKTYINNQTRTSCPHDLFDKYYTASFPEFDTLQKVCALVTSPPDIVTNKTSEKITYTVATYLVKPRGVCAGVPDDVCWLVSVDGECRSINTNTYIIIILKLLYPLFWNTRLVRHDHPTNTVCPKGHHLILAKKIDICLESINYRTTGVCDICHKRVADEHWMHCFQCGNYDCCLSCAHQD